MSNSKLHEIRLPLDCAFGPISRKKPKVNLDRLEEKRVKAEAERRATLVRGMGGSECGYCDGYQDGFEHAAQWLIDQLSDPLAVNYRRGAGMEHSKKYYAFRPQDRKRMLEWFEKIVIKPQEASK